MKVLITGTAGFIGFHLTERLLREGHAVIGVDQVNDYYDVNLKIDRLAFSGIDWNVEPQKGIRSSKHKQLCILQSIPRRQVSDLFYFSKRATRCGMQSCCTGRSSLFPQKSRCLHTK